MGTRDISGGFKENAPTKLNEGDDPSCMDFKGKGCYSHAGPYAYLVTLVTDEGEEYRCNDGHPAKITFITLQQGVTNGQARDIRVDCSAPHLVASDGSHPPRFKANGKAYPTKLDNVQYVMIQEVSGTDQVMVLCDVSIMGYTTPD